MSASSKWFEYLPGAEEEWGVRSETQVIVTLLSLECCSAYPVEGEICTSDKDQLLCSILDSTAVANKYETPPQCSVTDRDELFLTPPPLHIIPAQICS
jgi:hypothetical protein